MKPLAIGGLAALLVIGAVSYTGFRAAIRAGEFTTLTPVFDGTCTDVGGLPGPEDVQLDRAANVLFIASDDRRAAQAAAKVGQPLPRGAVYALPWDALETTSARVDITQGKPARFQPHGLSLHTAADGSRTLFVVNHPNGFQNYEGTTVEVYAVQADGLLNHTRSVSVPGLVRINDVVGTGPDSFYATSEFDPNQGRLKQAWGVLNGTDLSGSVWHVTASTGKGQPLADGLGFANSLALSADQRTLYATAATGRALFIYDADPTTRALTLRDKAFLGTGVDNLDLEPDPAGGPGRLWIGAHPKLLTFALGHAANGSPAPSQVIVVEPAKAGEKGGKVDQVYLKTGEPVGDDPGYSGSSVAVRSGNRMVIGSVFEKGLRVCTLPAVWKQSESHPAQRLLDTERDEKLKAEKKAADEAAKTAP
jgi:arylesterase / paraoxonase